MWSVADIADAIEAGLASECTRIDHEQAVRGIDALDELELHPLIEQALQREYGVFREQRYPADRSKRKASEGERCDFVITPDHRDLQQPDAADTLFDASDAVPLDEAFWLEIKIAHQFTIEGPNPRYGARMLSVPRKDVTKLSKDSDILHAGLGLIAFVQDEIVAQHDLHVWYERCVGKGLPIGYPSTRLFEMSDRLGNSICAIAICPVNHL